MLVNQRYKRHILREGAACVRLHLQLSHEAHRDLKVMLILEITSFSNSGSDKSFPVDGLNRLTFSEERAHKAVRNSKTLILPLVQRRIQYCVPVRNDSERLTIAAL